MGGQRWRGAGEGEGGKTVVVGRSHGHEAGSYKHPQPSPLLDVAVPSQQKATLISFNGKGTHLQEVCLYYINVFSGHSGHCPCWFVKLIDKKTVSKVIFMLNMNTFQILLVLQIPSDTFNSYRQVEPR
ncbi:hypothetical protein STEG23_016026 [Scotinomys teguina]